MIYRLQMHDDEQHLARHMATYERLSHLTLAKALALTHMMLPIVTTAALVALQGVRHCHGVASVQNHTPAMSATVAPLMAFTMPTPSAPSERYTTPAE